MERKRVLRAILLATAMALIAETAQAYEGDCFFMIAWDGVRYDQLDSYTAPFLLNVVAPEGIWLPNTYNAWHTWTSPGHTNFFTGNPSFHPNTGITWKLSHYYPSLMEAYLKEHNLTGDDTTWAWVFGNGANDSDWGSSRHASYNDLFKASHGFTFGQQDGVLWETMMQPTLEAYHPAIVWVDFHEVDYWGHLIEGPEDSLEYREAIRRADSLLAIIFQYIDTSSVYAGKTNVLITTDHGRHTSGILTGLRDHGCDCDGCRLVFGCLWGPDFKEDLVDHSYHYQTDIAYVVAHVMGLRAPHARTRTLASGWFSSYVPEDPWPYDPSGGERISTSGLPCSSPDVSCATDGTVHTVWCENQREVIYRGKHTTWRDPIVLARAAEDELLREPRISCYGNVVGALWQRYRTNDLGFHCWYLEMSASLDGGVHWSYPFTNILEDSGILTSDLVLGQDNTSVYGLVGGVYTAFGGSRDSIGVVNIVKVYDPNIWSEVAKYTAETYQANYLNLERFGPLCVAVCQAYDTLDRNSEILATWSNDDGENWEPNWIPITFDTGGSPYMHQHFPSGLLTFD
jgi:hypothetical protein